MYQRHERPISLRCANRAAVLNCLHLHGTVSRKQLSAMLHLTPAAITKIVAELITEGLVVECGSAESHGVGRREIWLSLCPDAQIALGVWLGLGSALLSAVRLDGEVLFSDTVSLPVRAEADATVHMLAQRLKDLSAQHLPDPDRILGVGIAVRGTITQDGRTVKDSFDTLDATDYPICERFEACIGLPTVLSNNVRALSAAQMFFAREPRSDSAFFVRCGTGVGAALIENGRILNGSRGQCAEIGHIPVIRQGGKPCHCGKSGCLETVASPTAIVESAQAILSESQTPLLWQLSSGQKTSVTLERVLDAARGGDAGAAAVVDRAIEALAAALKTVIYLFDPAQIVLYGKIFGYSYYLSRLKAEMAVGVDAAHAVRMEESKYNCDLEQKAAGLLMTVRFLENGGIQK